MSSDTIISAVLLATAIPPLIINDFVPFFSIAFAAFLAAALFRAAFTATFTAWPATLDAPIVAIAATASPVHSLRVSTPSSERLNHSSKGSFISIYFEAAGCFDFFKYLWNVSL